MRGARERVGEREREWERGKGCMEWYVSGSIPFACFTFGRNDVELSLALLSLPGSRLSEIFVRFVERNIRRRKTKQKIKNIRN